MGQQRFSMQPVHQNKFPVKFQLEGRPVVVSRRTLIAGLLALPIAACDNITIAQNITRAVRFSVLGVPDFSISRDAVTSLPYASVAAKIGKGPRSLLILWRRERDDLHWLSADNAALVTRGGRIVKTAGLPENIRDTVFTGPDPVATGLHENAHGLTATRALDLDPGQYGLSIRSNFAVNGPRQVTITEIQFDTILVTERNIARTLNWSFNNQYWVDPADGFVWKSRQHIARGFPPVILEMLKPAI